MYRTYIRSSYRPLDLAQRAKDSQIIKKKAKIPRVTDERWNSEKQLSGPVEKKRSGSRKLLYPHPKLSLALVPYKPFTLKYVDVACSIMVYCIILVCVLVNVPIFR